MSPGPVLALLPLTLWALLLAPMPFAEGGASAAAPPASLRPPATDPRLPHGYHALDFNGWAWAVRAGASSPTAGQAEAIRTSLDRVRALLGVPGRGRKPLVVYTTSRTAFEAVVEELGGGPPSDDVLALAFPARGVLVLDGSRMLDSRDGGFPATVTHELAHVVIGEVSPAVPRWYHEGLAQWVSGEQIAPEHRNQIAALAVADGLHSFRELSRFLPRQHGRTSILYTQSHMFVRFIDRRFGGGVHARLLAAMGGGADFDVAFARATGSTVADQEALWRDELRAGFSWIQWYVLNVGLFPSLAVLVILGFFFQRAIRRRRLARMAVEERALYGPDA